jgi:signal transduction histidine kinase
LPVLDTIESLLAPGEGDEDLRLVFDEARRRALGILDAAGGGGEAERLAAVCFAADVLAGLASAGSWDAARVKRLTAALARATGVPAPALSAELYGQTLRSLQASDLSPDLCAEAVLTAIRAFAPVSEASLWIRRPLMECVLFQGQGRPTRRMRAAARAVLTGNAAVGANTRGFVHAVPVLRRARPVAALVVRARPTHRLRALAFAEQAAASLGPVLEKEVLLERAAEREGALVETAERRLTRLGFDIHDGPLQEIAALAGDLRHFRTQLDEASSARPAREIVSGRFDDFDARLAELDRELRELAVSLESPSAVGRPLPEMLREHADLFAQRSGITVAIDVRGNFETLTPSHRLALVRVIQEALTNVREHSGATAASVQVVAGRKHSESVVTDDGRGFDVERTLVRAARRGCLGLVGMAERVRLLGGQLDVESRPGGPTRVLATIPRWEPLAARATEASTAVSAA